MTRQVVLSLLLTLLGCSQDCAQSGPPCMSRQPSCLGPGSANACEYFKEALVGRVVDNNLNPVVGAEVMTLAQGVFPHSQNPPYPALRDANGVASFLVPAAKTFAPDHGTLSYGVFTPGALPVETSLSARTIEHFPLAVDVKTLCSSSEDTKIPAWDLKKTSRVVDGGHGYARLPAMEPDGETLVSASFDNALRFGDCKKLKLTKKINKEGEIIADPDWRPKAEFIVGGSIKNTCIWEGKTDKLRSKIPAHERWVTAVALSPNGKQLVSGNFDKANHLWVLETGTKTATAAENRIGMIFSVAWFPNGEDVILAGQATSFAIWNLSTNKSSTLFRGHEDVVKEVRFSPNGELLASVSKDRSVRLWDPKSGQLLKSFKGHNAEIDCLAWSADGKYLASGCRSNEIYVWPVPAKLSLDGSPGGDGWGEGLDMVTDAVREST